MKVTGRYGAYLYGTTVDRDDTAMEALDVPALPETPEETIERLTARVAELERERDEARRVLAGPDIGSLPCDWSLSQVAEARANDFHDLRWQVRDTCKRAEAAEARASALAAENEKFRKALTQIMDDDHAESHPCGPQRYGHFGNIARAALEGKDNG